MRNEITNLIAARMAIGGFLVLYPIFYWYHIAIALNIMPMEARGLLSGLYGRTSALIVAVYAIYVFSSFWQKKDAQRTDADWIGWLFLAYLVWALSWATFNFYFLPKPYVGEVATKLATDLTLQSANFIVGSLLILRPSKVLVTLVAGIWISMVSFAFIAHDPRYDSLYHTLVLDPSFRDLRVEHSSFATYQGLARSVLMTTLLLIAFTKTFSLRLVIEIVGLLTMYIVGSRSEIGGYLSAIICLEFVLILINRDYFWRHLILGPVFLISIFCVLIGTSEFGLTSRISLITDLGSDVSWNTRMEQNFQAFETIRINPIFGEFGSHLENGTIGDIPHNILAAWTMLGLPGLLMITILLGGSSKHLILIARKNRLTTPISRFAILMCAMAVPQILITKSSFVEWLPLVFGCVIAASKDEERKSAEEST